MIYDLAELLRGNSYPGRGIVLGRSEDGARTVILYFIMGRSVNSRNRVFIRTNDGIRTQAFDPRKMSDPSLVIYHPVRCVDTEDGAVQIVTNGDQTDTIRDYLTDGKSYIEALTTREFEPDPPNFTPRISGLVFPCGSYALSILKTMESDDGCCLRHYYTYDSPFSGVGHFIHTYASDGDPLPSFTGEPVPVHMTVSGGLEAFASSVWEALDSDNKVSLYARETVMSTGESYDIIINKNT